MSHCKKNGTSDGANAGPRRFDEMFYGTVTVGERGQIVIPAQARRDFEIETGDKLLIMGRARKPGLMLCKIDALREFVTEYMEGLRLAEMQVADEQVLNEGEVA
jgi:AbrB family looped-hinge helix DNA binding protein